MAASDPTSSKSTSTVRRQVQPQTHTQTTSIKNPSQRRALRDAARGITSEKTETMVVTGSALSTANNQNANPVQIISAQDIQKTSATTLGDYLERIPSMGTQGSNNATSFAGHGESCPDIRNFGSNRVLVLVDGKRQVSTTTGCVDLSVIPVDQVSSIEILKDGGSELYGADAVSGVINIKLKHDLETGGVTVRGGISQYGDGQQGKISGYKGFNFDHGRGNVTIFGQYLTQSGVMQNDRAWSEYPYSSDPVVGSAASIGNVSGITPETRIRAAAGTPFYHQYGAAGLISNGTGGGENGFRPYIQNRDGYNWNHESLTSNLQQGSLSGDAHYTVNRHLNLYANVRYNHRISQQEEAGDPLSGGTPPSTLSSNWVLPENNPYNVWGQDVFLTHRFDDIERRQLTYDNDTWQVTSGANGDLIGGWRYDASMTYGISQESDTAQGMINYRHLLNELGVRQLNPSSSGSPVVYDPAVCTSQPGCALLNPFLPFSQQPAASGYASFTSNSHQTYQLRDFNFRVNNNHVVRLPYEHGGDIGIAGGIEHRSEQSTFVPDAIVASGDAGSTSQYTSGGFNVTEVYLEGKVPLLQNAFLAKDLTIDGQGRFSNYNTFGSVENWKVSINWAPVSDIRFRATLGTSFRQPNVNELYLGQSLSDPNGKDPCDSRNVSSYGAKAATVLANCAKAGVDGTKYQALSQNQIPVLTGGNRNLQPETGRTYTIGTIITPRWLPNLSASVDYWHYTLENMISTLPAQQILDGCYTGTTPSYCSSIASRSAGGDLTYVEDFYTNTGGLKTSGLDFDLSYRIRLTSNDSLSLENNFQQLISYQEQFINGGAWDNLTGRLTYFGGGGSLGSGGQPRVRDYMTATWRHNNFTFTYMMNYVGGMKLSDGTNDVSCKVYAYLFSPRV